MKGQMQRARNIDVTLNMQEEREMKLNNAAVAFIVGALSLFGAGMSYAGEHKEHSCRGPHACPGRR